VTVGQLAKLTATWLGPWLGPLWELPWEQRTGQRMAMLWALLSATLLAVQSAMWLARTTQERNCTALHQQCTILVSTHKPGRRCRR
jgi:hypothetical protein